mmetsp:Transcript_2850/g.4318  ORF Transcript_2850/g.4318 Transcript_2850/m.4318 type:complete len:287 (+) Transcript_2850:138-998(+)|eukprot:CAMPEP_0185024996 /NCGR_PEP_ID=MMETSP1103-20130426/8128_1 /TAXON_ID=36769 /ORGANISM="Paraphysomonas bandaiensis, Strain Caron Lab Isolate" /LENGTH=286 /DNA_ID=CAMNT_0027558103 /DNA_START=113 /DNA_END=973 /DNA_ORIENTATION=+
MATTKKKPSTTSALVTGCIAGGIECVCMWPMEYMKTLLQLHSKTSNPPFTGVLGGLQYTVRTTGFFSLYRGLGVTLLFSMPKAGIRFGGNAYCKKLLADDQGKLSMGRNFLAGVGAGVLEAVLAVTPMEAIKTATIEHNLGLVPGIKKILVESGPAGFYKGLFATVLKQSSNQGLRFMFYNKFKDIATKEGKEPLSPIGAVVGGMMAGCFSTCLNNPFDVVKTRMQGSGSTKYSSTLNCAITMLKEEGITTFYRGLVPRCGRVVPGQGIIFLSFETVQVWVCKFLD